jgi:endonuclease YncB( thermonuclease family)
MLLPPWVAIRYLAVPAAEGVMPGVLRVRGTIDLEQFWPDGESDADTTKIKVTVGDNSFAFAPDGKTFKTTKAYFGAFSRGAARKEVIDKHGRITVRLQGIDAPELHYRAAPLKTSSGVSKAKREKFNLENKAPRRQYWAETATVALARKLLEYEHPVDCEVVSFVDKPFEVIDTYGRFVANIRVGPKFKTDINLWLSEQGWGYPTFYSSMEPEEIEAFLKTLKRAQAKGRIWKDYSHDTSKFDSRLVYRPKGQIQPSKDKGKVLMPKVFRRQLSYRIQKKAGVVGGSFTDYLKAHPDDCFKLDEFLEHDEHSAPLRHLHDFMKGNKFTPKPQEIVFREAESSLVNKNGKKIVKF